MIGSAAVTVVAVILVLAYVVVAHPFHRWPITGGFMSLTPEQRQQMMQQRTSACDGLADGDNCTMQSTRGNFTGTCQTLNDALMCGFARNGSAVPAR